MNSLFDIPAPPAPADEADGRCWVLRTQHGDAFSVHDTGVRGDQHFPTREAACEAADVISTPVKVAVPVLLDRRCAVVYCSVSFETLADPDDHTHHYPTAADAAEAARAAGWAIDTSTGTPAYVCPDCKENPQ